MNNVHDSFVKLQQMCSALFRTAASPLHSLSVHYHIDWRSDCSGLLSAHLSALCTGATTVLFSDYNKEVIQFVTIPNVIANCPTAIQQEQQQVLQHSDASAHMTNSRNTTSSRADHRKRDEQQHNTDSKHDDTTISNTNSSNSSSSSSTKSAAVFYSGDWLSLPEQLLLQHDSVGNQFDLILTAETLYTEQVANQVLTRQLHLCSCCVCSMMYCACRRHIVACLYAELMQLVSAVKRSSTIVSVVSMLQSSSSLNLRHLYFFIIILVTDSPPHAQVYTLIKQLLAPQGVALVAAKRYYFGCGGGCDYFKQLVNANAHCSGTTIASGNSSSAISSSSTSSSRLQCETVRVVDTGVANIREILRVTWVNE
jgi:hypothetical protein